MNQGGNYKGNKLPKCKDASVTEPNALTRWQNLLSMWNSACGQVFDCDECPYGAGGDNSCFDMWNYFDSQTGYGAFAKRVEHHRLQTEGKKVPRKEHKIERVMLQCAPCKFQEEYTLIDGRLTDVRKFNQVADGTIVHMCQKGGWHIAEIFRGNNSEGV